MKDLIHAISNFDTSSRGDVNPPGGVLSFDIILVFFAGVAMLLIYGAAKTAWDRRHLTPLPRGTIVRKVRGGLKLADVIRL